MPKGCGWLLVEFGDATKEAAREQAERMIAHLKTPTPASGRPRRLRRGREARARVEGARGGARRRVLRPRQAGHLAGVGGHRRAPRAARRLPARLASAVRALRLPPGALRALREGCVHCRWRSTSTRHAGVATYRRFAHEAAALVASLRRLALGRARRRAVARRAPREDVRRPSCGAPSASSRHLGPGWQDEPRQGRRRVADRRATCASGGDYRPCGARDALQVPRGPAASFAHATLRCVGIGKCRRSREGARATMCPSYMVTREEKHTTRGRAHLLWEMLDGDADRRAAGASEEVKEALDLCLACKGCKGDCPVNVDMATLQGRVPVALLRGTPAPAQRLRVRAHRPVGAARARDRAGPRQLRDARRPSRRGALQARRRASRRSGDPGVRARDVQARGSQRAARARADGSSASSCGPTRSTTTSIPRSRTPPCDVLEDAGFAVVVAEAPPLLRPAALRLRDARSAPSVPCGSVLDTLRADIEAGDARRRCSSRAARRCSATSSRISSRTRRTPPACATRLHARASSSRAHGAATRRRDSSARRSCRATATTSRSSGTSDEKELLGKMGMDARDRSRRGAAAWRARSASRPGSTSDVSVAAASACCCPPCGRRTTTRSSSPTGSRARSRSRRRTSRRALHVAEVIAMALRDGPGGPAGYGPPERAQVERAANEVRRSRGRAIAGIGVAVVAVTAAALLTRRGRWARAYRWAMS